MEDKLSIAKREKRKGKTQQAGEGKEVV